MWRRPLSGTPQSDRRSARVFVWLCTCICLSVQQVVERCGCGSIIISCSRTGSPASSDSPRMCAHQHPDGGSQKLIYTLGDTVCCTTVTALKRRQRAHTDTQKHKHTHTQTSLKQKPLLGLKKHRLQKIPASNFIDFFFFFQKPGHPHRPLFTHGPPFAPSLPLRSGLDDLGHFLYVIGGQHHDLFVLGEGIVKDSVQQALPVKL